MNNEKCIVTFNHRSDDDFSGYYQKFNYKNNENCIWYFSNNLATHIAGSPVHKTYSQHPLVDIYNNATEWEKLDVTHVWLMSD